MRIVVGSDHAGYTLKEHVKGHLTAGGHDVEDVGTDSEKSADYPSFAEAAARKVADGAADRAVIVCGSGVGVCIVANKVDGIRAVNAHDPEEAGMARLHNDANALTLGARRIEPAEAETIVASFLGTDFEGGRHARRVDLINDVEAR